MNMKTLRIIYWVGLFLLILGGLNWGLVALLNYDLVQILFEDFKYVPQIIYGLLGLSAIYVAIVSPLFIKKNREV